ncbi:MAG: gliding motility-associated C-terminal domain-containing protein [Bacteroidetes bacterium]|nr:gliding motility-associated C-terminal domain-containing protein [Bacteroidota bacterium]MDA1242938.1 gliding motility-associated C-terminal domain-containing protein [Bacteroidota bacterium]
MATIALMAGTSSSFAQLCTFGTQGTATTMDDGCIEWSPAPNSTSGAVWAQQPLDLTQPFRMEARLNFGDVDHGGEGFVLVLQPEGPDASPNFESLALSFGLEFDTKHDMADGDIAQDHLAFISDGSALHAPYSLTAIAGPVTAIPSGNDNIQDGDDHRISLTWDPASQALVAAFDCEDRLIASVDLIDDIFEGQTTVWWGFTASMASGVNVQRACLAPNALGTDNHVKTCPQAAVQLVAGGMDGSNYQWTPSNVVSEATVFNPTYTGVEDQTLVVEYTDACGQLRSDVVMVEVEAVEVHVLGVDHTIDCTHNGVLSMEASSNFGSNVEYSWTFNNAWIGDGALVEASEAGWFAVQASFPGGSSVQCMGTDQRFVEVDTVRLDVDAGPAALLDCNAPMLPLLGSTSSEQHASYLWTTEDGWFQGPTDQLTATASASGTYTLHVTNLLNGCVSSDQVTVEADFTAPWVVVGEPEGELGCNQPVVDMTGVDVGPSGYTALYTWNGPEGTLGQSMDPNPGFTLPGSYTLTVEFLENGCTTVAKESVDVQGSEMLSVDLNEVVMPNVMTPDHDSSLQNERLVPFIPGREDLNVMTMLDEYHLTVFNRWGQVVFRNDGQPLQWDGRVGGDIVDEGTYMVHARLLSGCGENQFREIQGSLEVILGR